MKKMKYILFVIGILLICFSSIIGRWISWSVNINHDTCYAISDHKCGKNIDDLIEGGFEKDVTKYYNGVQTSSEIFRSLGVVISTISGVIIFTKKKTNINNNSK